jgi:hypothetical protein
MVYMCGNYGRLFWGTDNGSIVGTETVLALQRCKKKKKLDDELDDLETTRPTARLQ